MPDVICISSSDDEEMLEKSVNCSNNNGKLKKSFTLKRKGSPVRLEIDEKKSKILEKNGVFKNIESSSNGNRVDNLKENSTKNNSTTKSQPANLEISKELKNHDKRICKIDTNNKTLCTSSKEPTPQKKIVPQLVVKERIPIPEAEIDIFKEFVEVCVKKKNDDETKMIISKLKKYYDQLNQYDIENEEFRLFLNSYVHKIKNNSHGFYKYILEVKEEIKRRVKNPSTKADEQETYLEKGITKDAKEEDDDLPVHVRKNVRRLEDAIIRCKQKIKSLEEAEVNFDDDENSVYIQEDRYKRKLIQLCRKLSEIVNDKEMKKKIYKTQLKRKDINGDMTNVESVDNAIIKFVNSGVKKVNKMKHIQNMNYIADFLPLPDLCDIIKCIKTCNQKDKLHLDGKRIEKMARSAHKAIGYHLKNQRIHESHDYISSLVEENNEDPAKRDPFLEEKLRKNKKEGDKKLEEIFEKFVDKQQNLEPEDEPMNSDVDSDNEKSDISENKEERKANEPNGSLSGSDDERMQKDVKTNCDFKSEADKKKAKVKSIKSIDNSREGKSKAANFETIDKTNENIMVEVHLSSGEDNPVNPSDHPRQRAARQAESKIDKPSGAAAPAAERATATKASSTRTNARGSKDDGAPAEKSVPEDDGMVDPLLLPSSETVDIAEDSEPASDEVGRMETVAAAGSARPASEGRSQPRASILAPRGSSIGDCRPVLTMKPLPSNAQTAIVPPLLNVSRSSTSLNTSQIVDNLLSNSIIECDVIIEESSQILQPFEPKSNGDCPEEVSVDEPEALSEEAVGPTSQRRPIRPTADKPMPVLKLASFANLPASWKESSPQKNQQRQRKRAPEACKGAAATQKEKKPNLTVTLEEALKDMWHPGYEDLSSEITIKHVSTKLRNPLANSRSLQSSADNIVRDFNNCLPAGKEPPKKAAGKGHVIVRKVGPFVGKKISDSMKGRCNGKEKPSSATKANDIVRSSWL